MTDQARTRFDLDPRWRQSESRPLTSGPMVAQPSFRLRPGRFLGHHSRQREPLQPRLPGAVARAQKAAQGLGRKLLGRALQLRGPLLEQLVQRARRLNALAHRNFSVVRHHR